MLSLPKLLVLAAVVGVVILLGQLFRRRVGGRSGRGDAGGSNHESSDSDAAVEMLPCAVCGNFVAAEAARCERRDCPQPA